MIVIPSKSFQTKRRDLPHALGAHAIAQQLPAVLSTATAFNAGIAGTARNAAEEPSREHLADLAHVARLSTVGQMFSELAHEINQPLTAAANYARACVRFARSEQGASREQLIEWMEKSVAQAQRAIELVKRLGSFVKKDGGSRSFANINRVIDQAVNLSLPAMRLSAEDGEPIRLQVNFDEAVPEIAFDPVQIEQVTLNLIRNAIDAMGETQGIPRMLTLETTHDDHYVRVSVRDTGPGIPADRLAKLFDPYFTTKADGIGLGLSISRSIIEDHEGRLDAESTAEGTTFRFFLPIRKTGTPE